MTLLLTIRKPNLRIISHDKVARNPSGDAISVTTIEDHKVFAAEFFGDEDARSGEPRFRDLRKLNVFGTKTDQALGAFYKVHRRAADKLGHKSICRIVINIF